MRSSALRRSAWAAAQRTAFCELVDAEKPATTKPRAEEVGLSLGIAWALSYMGRSLIDPTFFRVAEPSCKVAAAVVWRAEVASPYAFLGLNFFNTVEYQMRHIARLVSAMKQSGASTFEVTEEANTRYRDRMAELIGDSVFEAGNCATARSYYFDPCGEATLLRPMSTRTAIREASHFPLSDYKFA